MYVLDYLGSNFYLKIVLVVAAAGLVILKIGASNLFLFILHYIRSESALGNCFISLPAMALLFITLDLKVLCSVLVRCFCFQQA
jgi:uncharacterized membrane protein